MKSELPLTPSELDELLEVARQGACLAGQVLRERLDQPHRIALKGLRDIVTEADLAAEEAILEHLRREVPGHPVLSEEATPDAQALAKGFCWTVDPLDGTSNYARGLPFFSVCIAALHDGWPVVAVTYEVTRDWTFWARRGGGTFWNGSRRRVRPTERLLDAMVSFDWGRSQQDRQRVLNTVQRIGPEVGTCRTWGSAALGLCYVAAGWCEAYFHVGLNLWDMAGGVLLVEEAGGRVTQLTGQPWDLEAASILASNGMLHDNLVEPPP